MSDTLFSLGKTSKTTILAIEDNKLSIEFANSGVVLKTGTPVKMTADGKLAIWLKTDPLVKLIGHVYGPETSNAGELCTVFMRGHLMVYALSAEALDCDTPVTHTDYDTTHAVVEPVMAGNTGFQRYEQAGSDTACGWTLDQVDLANELIKVVLFH